MKKNDHLFITKASGKSAPFSADKLRHSLEKAGAGEDAIEQILKEIDSKLYEGMTTKKIYRIAFNLLKVYSRPLAAKYHLKQGIMELGPTGYPFEKFIAELLRHQGYKVTLGQTIQGKCVSHEIDVVAEKDEHHFMIECKFHNLQGTFSDVKIPLYIQARFKDVQFQWLKLPGHETKFHQGWVVTNTRFSSDAIQYGSCAGLKLLGWDYPKKNSLKELVDNLGLYPITCLTTLTKKEKQHLLDKNIVLCKDIINNEDYLLQSIVGQTRIEGVIKEASQLCQQLEERKK